MRPQDLHTHSLYDDGKCTLEEMVQAAVGKRLSAIGLSGHSPIENEQDWTMPKEKLPQYMAEVKRLKAKYRVIIPVFCGIEYDLRSKLDLSTFDYVIGSVHATVTPDGCFDADNTAEIAKDGIKRYFAGNADAAAECYFSQYAEMANNPEIHIVGHFDLLTKFDEREAIYDPESKTYLQAAFAAMESLVKAGKIFEVNTGAISRGYRTSPYPAKNLLKQLHSLGGRICLNSDAHSTDGIACAFDSALELIKACGFREIWMLTAQGFAPVSVEKIEYL
ncbi:MAG: histidinol-phosphatase HisJ family protein [Ruminococcaceae bacterium]|nr:histidinol-phosphatase HisJ family protein [Oscillospiraceae bacterium]